MVALVGGFLPAMLAAVGGSLLLNYYFAPPLHTFTIRETNNALALGVFIVVAALVSSVVDLAARRTRQAARATAESETLGTLAGSILRGETALPALLERVREAFGLTSVTLLERSSPTSSDGGAAARGPADEWTVVAIAGATGASARRTPTPRCRPATPSCSPCAGGRCAPRTSGSSAPSPRRPPSSWNGTGSARRPRPRCRSPRATGCAPRCSPPSDTTCARRWRRRRPP